MTDKAYHNLASLPSNEVYTVLKKSVAETLQGFTDDQLLAFIKSDAREISKKAGKTQIPASHV